MIFRYVNEIVKKIADSEFDEFRHHRGATSYHLKMMLKSTHIHILNLNFLANLNDWLAQDQTPSYKLLIF